MANRETYTAEYIRQLLAYNPETGELIWKRRTPDMFNPSSTMSQEHSCNQWNSRLAGRTACQIDSHGYCQVKIFARKILAHRIIWLIMTGCYPEREIDHKNGDRKDNKWSNLRQASRPENCQNRAYLMPHGLPGVTKRGDKWRAQIKLNGKVRSLGTFHTKEDAADAYVKAKAAFHKFQPNPCGRTQSGGLNERFQQH